MMLQNWLAQQYSTHGRPGEALALAERRFRQHPTRQAFNAIRRAAELPGLDADAWANRRPALIDYLREQHVWSALVELSLDEDDIGAALDAFASCREHGETGGGMTEDLLLRLVEAAEQDFPDRVADLYRQLAEGRIERRQRSDYKVAAKYLASAKDLLETQGRTEEWRDLISYVREGYPTLRALQEELDNLDLE